MSKMRAPRATLGFVVLVLCSAMAAGQQAPPAGRTFAAPGIVLVAPPDVLAESRPLSLASGPPTLPHPQANGAVEQHGMAGRVPTLPSPAAPARNDQWSPDDIAVAKALCNLKLKGLDAVVIPQPAFRLRACGAPAAVQVISIGKNPQVALSPPPVLTCDMVAGLAQWLRDGVQPAAQRHLGAPVVRIDVMSDYSCRGAYGRAHNRLSEHGRANALDIRGFLTANATETALLADWGPTAREIRHQVAVAKAAAERAAAEKALAAKSAPAAPAAGPQPAGGAAPAATGIAAALPAAVGTMIDGVPSLRLPGPRSGEASTGYGLGTPSRLGGPKSASVVVAAPSPQARSLFLRQAHAAACRIFGTTLGPEADSFHRNHFHVDMATRSSRTICE